MTVQQAIQKVVDLAYSQVGYREGTNNYNKYAAYLDPLGITYGAKQNLAWCGEFVLWVFVQCFGVKNALEMLCSPNPTGIPVCENGAKYFKNAGRWTNKPSVGDVIFFNVSGGINHTGIVVGVTSKAITTVEGNSSDMVSRRTYSVSEIGGKIAGFGVPKWSVVADQNVNDEIVVEDPIENSAPEVKGFSLSFHYLSNGAGMDALRYLRDEVRAVQQLLIAKGYTCGGYGDDGEFGSGTEQSVRNFQFNNGLEVDGVVGPKTRAKLEGVIAK